MTTSPVRPLTDEEVAHYAERGWVHVPDYLAPSYVSEMLLIAKERLGGFESAGPAWFNHVDDVSGRDDVYRLVGRSEQTGKNVERLLRRNVGVRYWIDNLACKIPASWNGANMATPYHQDAAHFPIDRSATVTCWIALDDIAPEQGSMRFFEGSHRSDVLGDPECWQSDEEILDIHPWLRDFPLSPALTYQPGDATFHHSQIVHGAPLNSGTAPRWNYATVYLGADARFNGADCAETHGLGLPAREPIDHPAFPLIWKGSATSAELAAG